jgi:hypothetical protein
MSPTSPTRTYAPGTAPPHQGDRLAGVHAGRSPFGLWLWRFLGGFLGLCQPAIARLQQAAGALVMWSS